MHKTIEAYLDVYGKLFITELFEGPSYIQITQTDQVLLPKRVIYRCLSSIIIIIALCSRRCSEALTY